jgi:hypothetical protein
MTKDLLIADIVSRIPDMAKDSPENNSVLLSGLIGNFQKEIEDALDNRRAEAWFVDHQQSRHH